MSSAAPHAQASGSGRSGSMNAYRQPELNLRSTFRIRNTMTPFQEEVHQPLEPSVEGYYEFHLYSRNGYQRQDFNKMLTHAKELVIRVGGQIREDWRIPPFGLVTYTLPPGVTNPIMKDDEQWRGKIYSKYWPKYTEAERKIFYSKDEGVMEPDQEDRIPDKEIKSEESE